MTAPTRVYFRAAPASVRSALPATSTICVSYLSGLCRNPAGCPAHSAFKVGPISTTSPEQRTSITRHGGRLHRLAGIRILAGLASVISTALSGPATAPRRCPWSSGRRYCRTSWCGSLAGAAAWSHNHPPQPPWSAANRSTRSRTSSPRCSCAACGCRYGFTWNQPGGERRHTVTIDEYGGVHWTGSR